MDQLLVASPVFQLCLVKVMGSGVAGGELAPQHTPLSVQESTLSDDSTPPSSSPKIPSGPRQETKCSYPYHTLSQSSDEVSQASPCSCWGPGQETGLP